jgi:hypothetical protein
VVIGALGSRAFDFEQYAMHHAARQVNPDASDHVDSLGRRDRAH